MASFLSLRPSFSAALSNPIRAGSRFYSIPTLPTYASLPGITQTESSQLLSTLNLDTKKSGNSKSSHTIPRKSGYGEDAARTFGLDSRGSAKSLSTIPPTLDQRWSRLTPVGKDVTFTTTSARSVSVKNSDVGYAYRQLNRILMDNNIKRELKQQERFESPSNRRVRLNSERHRRRYKAAVGKAVGLAIRMKN